MAESKIVKPRSPGLWMADVAPGSDLDSHQVEKARLHLIALLRDPYYQEAVIRLKRSGKLADLIKDPGGNSIHGSIAHKLQHPQKPKPKRDGPGRPKTPAIEGLTKLLDAIERNPKKGRTLIDWCRRIVRDEWPNATEEQCEKVSKEMQRKMLDIRRQRKIESN